MTPRHDPVTDSKPKRVALFDAKKYDSAIEHFLTASTGYAYEDVRADARFEAGRTWKLLNKPQQAAKYFQEFVDNHPEHEKVEAAKKQIEELSKQ